MKKVIFNTLALGFILLIAVSCKKECGNPNPKNPTEGGGGSATNGTITLQGAAVSDVGVRSVYGDVNLEYTITLPVWATTQSGVPDIGRSYIKFDYSSIPSTATITKATLMLYPDSTQEIVGYQTGNSTMDGPDNFFVSPVTSAWAANTLTWNTQPTWDSNIQVSAPASTQLYENYSIDITSIAQNQFKNSSSNYGIVLYLATETPYRGLVFNSSNHNTADPATTPQLVIQYQ